ncbi:MAG: glycosyltransferase family 2 protein [Ignavibacteria bacterium]|nr:glycosyltransferase family 2 protein [Ignavibacteria bacterium]
MKISAVVITKNEELNIRECLETLKWADEIVIIDSNSTDNTPIIASEFTDKIFSTDSDVFSEKRAMSFEKCSNDWILFLDADERITPQLQEEILSLSPAEGVYGYRLNRRNYYFGQWLKYSGVYPDKHIRLFNKRHASITPRIIHEGVEVSGSVEELKNDFIHYSFRDMTHMMDKINLYSTLEAREKLINNKQISKAGVFTHALSAFLRVYISRKGYKDGTGGFFISFCYSIVSFLSHLKLLKLQGKI